MSTSPGKSQNRNAIYPGIPFHFFSSFPVFFLLTETTMESKKTCEQRNQNISRIVTTGSLCADAAKNDRLEFPGNKNDQGREDNMILQK